MMQSSESTATQDVPPKELVDVLFEYCTESGQKQSLFSAFGDLEKKKTKTMEILEKLETESKDGESLLARFNEGSTWIRILGLTKLKEDLKFSAQECREINRLLQVYEPAWILLREMYITRKRKQKLERIEIVMDRVVEEIKHVKFYRDEVQNISGCLKNQDKSSCTPDPEKDRMEKLEAIEKKIDTLMRAVFAYFNKIRGEFANFLNPVHMGWAELSQGSQTTEFYKTYMAGLFDAVQNLPKDIRKERQGSILRKKQKMSESKILCSEAIRICNEVYSELSHLLRLLVIASLNDACLKQEQTLLPHQLEVGPCGEHLVHTIFIWGQGDFVLDLLSNKRNELIREVENFMVNGKNLMVWATKIIENCSNDEFVAKWLSIEFQSDMDPWPPIKEKNHRPAGLYTGETVLHVAIANREREIVKKLLEAGASLSSKASGSFFQPKKLYHYEQNSMDQNSSTSNSFRKLNHESGCYYGEFPLSFAASVGDTDICYLIVHNRKRRISSVAESNPPFSEGPTAALKNENVVKPVRMMKEERDLIKDGLQKYTAELQKIDGPATNSGIEQLNLKIRRHCLCEFVGQQDSFGNTALHMAVLYDRHDVIDWLLNKPELKFCLQVTNNDGFTPCTLAVKTGNVALFDRILTKHMSKILWEFGKVGCRTTDLSQIDSFRMNEQVKKLPSPNTRSLPLLPMIMKIVCVKVKTLSRVGGSDETTENQTVQSNRFTLNPAYLHGNKKWRSVIEIIAEDRIREYLKHPLFLKLINDKWKKFGLRMHLKYRLCPFLWGLVLHTTASLMLMSEMERNNLLSGKGMGSMCINVKTGGLDFWHGDTEVYTSVTLRCILCFVYPAWLVWESLNFQGFTMSDLDPAKENPRVSISDARLFLFRNMEPILDLLSAIALVASGVVELMCAREVEIAAMAAASITLFCNFLLCLLPFKVIATMIITIYTILFVDVTTFLIIFLIILSGFSLSVAQLYTGYKATSTSPSSDWSILVALVSVLLGEGFSGVSDLTQTSDLPGLSSFIAYFWVFLCNILLLNFLIATMSDTFNKHKQEAYEIWITPFARKVLKYEKRLDEDQKTKHRYGRPLPSSDSSNGVYCHSDIVNLDTGEPFKPPSDSLFFCKRPDSKPKGQIQESSLETARGEEPQSDSESVLGESPRLRRVESRRPSSRPAE